MVDGMVSWLSSHEIALSGDKASKGADMAPVGGSGTIPGDTGFVLGGVPDTYRPQNEPFPPANTEKVCEGPDEKRRRQY